MTRSQLINRVVHALKAKMHVSTAAVGMTDNEWAAYMITKHNITEQELQAEGERDRAAAAQAEYAMDA